jgi:hypothetical protein
MHVEPFNPPITIAVAIQDFKLVVGVVGLRGQFAGRFHTLHMQNRPGLYAKAVHR